MLWLVLSHKPDTFLSRLSARSHVTDENHYSTISRTPQSLTLCISWWQFVCFFISMLHFLNRDQINAQLLQWHLKLMRSNQHLEILFSVSHTDWCPNSLVYSSIVSKREAMKKIRTEIWHWQMTWAYSCHSISGRYTLTHSAAKGFCITV